MKAQFLQQAFYREADTQNMPSAPALPYRRMPARQHSSGEDRRVNRMAARKDNASSAKRPQPGVVPAGTPNAAKAASRSESVNGQRPVAALAETRKDAARDSLREPSRTRATVAQSADQAGESLEQCVFRSLDQYFSDLDGAKPHALHEMVLGAIEKPLLQFALQRCEGNQSAAADLLGINRNTLRRKLQDYGLH